MLSFHRKDSTRGAVSSAVALTLLGMFGVCSLERANAQTSTAFHPARSAFVNSSIVSAGDIMSPTAPADELKHYLDKYLRSNHSGTEGADFAHFQSPYSAMNAAQWGLVGTYPPVYSYQQLQLAFSIALNSGANWALASDGCFDRAQIANNAIAAYGLPLAAKSFLFGLGFQHTLAAGVWNWWYHIALEVNVGGIAYIIDPSLYAAGPIPKGTWMQMIGGVGAITTCSPWTYGPANPC